MLISLRKMQEKSFLFYIMEIMWIVKLIAIYVPDWFLSHGMEIQEKYMN